MNELITYFKKNMTKVSTIFVILVVIVIFIVGSTYASGNYKIVFNRAENTEVMKTCETDVNGKLTDDCISTISSVCSRWSLQQWYGGSHVQTDQISVSEFANIVFTEDTNYYCVAHSSGDYNMGCYVCDNDDSVMKWDANGKSDNKCSAGYTKSNTILSEEECVIPDSCYVCNNDNNIMKWDNDASADKECSSGYSPIDKPISQCKTIIPDSCYVCNSDNNIMKWDNDGSADNKCSSGYTAVNKTESQCVPVDNPKTGNILMFFVYLIGLSTICYSFYFYKNIKEK